MAVDWGYFRALTALLNWPFQGLGIPLPQSPRSSQSLLHHPQAKAYPMRLFAECFMSVDLDSVTVSLLRPGFLVPSPALVKGVVQTLGYQV